MATIYTIDNSEVIRLLNDGAVGVLPTDTVYGLSCRAADKSAVTRLYNLKRRDNKPGTVIAANIDQLTELGIKARYLKAVQHFWPNPISIVIPSQDLEYIHLGKSGIAIRIPKSAELTTLLEETGPLLTTSANQPGSPEAANIKQARDYFGDSIDFYIDGGDLSGRKPSTVIRIVDDAVEVLRQGAVRISETGEVSDDV